MCEVGWSLLGCSRPRWLSRQWIPDSSIPAPGRERSRPSPWTWCMRSLDRVTLGCAVQTVRAGVLEGCSSVGLIVVARERGKGHLDPLGVGRRIGDTAEHGRLLGDQGRRTRSGRMVGNRIPPQGIKPHTLLRAPTLMLLMPCLPAIRS
jgi:hypothetical protein